MSSENDPRMEAIRRLLGQVNTLISELGSPRDNTVTAPTLPSDIPASSAVQHRSIPAQTANTGQRSVPAQTLAELRRAFQPYSREGQRGAGRPARRSLPREWSRRVVCLDAPATKVPNPSQMTWLKDEGLGEQVLTTVTTCEGPTLTAMLRESFPKLGTRQFALYKSVGGGAGQPLVRIHQSIDVPGISILSAACRGIIYICPASNILNIELDQGHEDGTDEYDETGTGMETDPSTLSNQLETSSPRSSVNDARSNSELPHASHQETAFSSASTVSRITQDAEVLTVEEHREGLYRENPDCQRIQISRENFLEELFGVYKSPDFKFTLKPHMKFVGEPGADIGALTKEYFWKGFISLTQEKLDGKSLFEGAADHRVPTADSRLLRCGAFRTVGLFMGHAITHCGIGFLGLSEAVVEYLTTENTDSDTPFSITIDDVPDIDVQDSLRLVAGLKRGATLSESERRSIQETAQLADFHEIITINNASEAFEQLLYHQVIEKRKPYLDAMKNAMKQTGILTFLFDKPYLRNGIFPRTGDVTYPSSLIVDRIECTESSEILAVMKNYVGTLDKDKMQKLLAAWTGWPIIPESNLKIVVEEEGDFKAQSCFNTIYIPAQFTEGDVKFYMDLLLENNKGFGLI